MLPWDEAHTLNVFPSEQLIVLTAELPLCLAARWRAMPGNSLDFSQRFGEYVLVEVQQKRKLCCFAMKNELGRL